MGFEIAMLNLPPCSRCGQTLLLTATPPPGIDEPLLELCAWCDAETDSVAVDLIAALGGPLTVELVPRISELWILWYRQVMASRGWFQQLDGREPFEAWEQELGAGSPGPLSPEAEGRILGLYSRLADEEADRSADPGQD